MSEHDSESEKLPEEPRAPAWRFVLLVFALSRSFYLLAGALFARIVPIDPQHAPMSDVPSIWAHWDGLLYLDVAAQGYPEGHLTGVGGPTFFPLYPLVVRAVTEFFGGPLSRGGLSVFGVLVSLIAFYFALYFVYRIAEEGWCVRVAQGAVLTLAFFPTSFFFNSVFTESLFLALSAGAVWAVRVRKDFLLACLLAGLATATRNIGVFLLIPLVLEWWRARRDYGWRGIYLALAPAGLLAYMAYLWWRFGEPLAFYTEQSRWERGASSIDAIVVNAFSLAYGVSLGLLLDPATYESFSFERLFIVLRWQEDLYNLVFFLAALLVLGVGWKLLPDGLWVYSFWLIATPAIVGPLGDPLQSTPRYLLVAFPLFIVLGVILKNRKLLAGWVLVSASFSLVFTALFVGWWFVA